MKRDPLYALALRWCAAVDKPGISEPADDWLRWTYRQAVVSGVTLKSEAVGDRHGCTASGWGMRASSRHRREDVAALHALVLLAEQKLSSGVLVKEQRWGAHRRARAERSMRRRAAPAPAPAAAPLGFKQRLIAKARGVIDSGGSLDDAAARTQLPRHTIENWLAESELTTD